MGHRHQYQKVRVLLGWALFRQYRAMGLVPYHQYRAMGSVLCRRRGRAMGQPGRGLNPFRHRRGPALGSVLCPQGRELYRHRQYRGRGPGLVLFHHRRGRAQAKGPPGRELYRGRAQVQARLEQVLGQA